MRRKGMILSQNRYFHSGALPPGIPTRALPWTLWGAHNATKPPAAKGPETIPCPAFQFSKVGKYASIMTRAIEKQDINYSDEVNLWLYKF